MTYGAITLDTSIFSQNGYRLESGRLKTLEQFSYNTFLFVLSEIVVKEVYSHLTEKTSKAQNNIKKAIKDSILYIPISDENNKVATKALLTDVDATLLVVSKLTSFIQKTNAKLIYAKDHVCLNQLVEKYFTAEPPFTAKGKKKSEFPDALA